MNADLKIDLSGIPEDLWNDRYGRCAECRRFFDEIEEEDPESGHHVPLLLWRKDGQEMLQLCWPCAEKRMGTTETLSGAE